MRRAARIAAYVAGGLAALAALLSLAGILVLRSDWFRVQVRQRIAREIENATGGRAEVGELRFDWRSLRAEAGPFVLHGSEPSSEAPLFRARLVRVGIKIVSAFRRDVDIASLEVEEPEVRIRVGPDGRTNIPGPKVGRLPRVQPVETILGLAIGRFRIADGLLEYSSRRIPLDISGQALRVELAFEAAGPRYLGTVSSERLLVGGGPFAPVPFNARVSLAVEKDRIVFSQARFTTGASSIQAIGAMTDFASPRAAFRFDAKLSLAEMGRPLRIPLPARGAASLAGEAVFGPGGDYSITGRLNASGLSFERAGVRVNGIGLSSGIDVKPKAVKLEGLQMQALRGAFSGRAELVDLRRFRVEGEVRNLALEELGRLGKLEKPPFSGSVSGAVAFQGEVDGAGPRGVKGTAQLAITPAPGSLPVHGALDLRFDQRASRLEFGRSLLATPTSRLEFSGSPARSLSVEFESTNLADLTPFAAALGGASQEEFPVRLDKGSAAFTGSIAGGLRDPRVVGRVSVRRLLYEGQRVDTAAAGIALSKTEVRLRNLALEQGPLRLEGELTAALKDWKPERDGAVSGSFSLRGAPIAGLLAAAGNNLPAKGDLSGKFEVGGTVGSPAVAGKATATNLEALGERFDRVRADFRYSGQKIEVPSAEIASGPARILASGAYEGRTPDWKTGDLRFEVSVKAVKLSQWNFSRSLSAETEAEAAGSARGALRIEKAQAQITALSGDASLRQLSFRGKPVGNLRVSAQTSGATVQLGVEGVLAGANVAGQGTVQLNAANAARGQVRFSGVSLSSVESLLSRTDAVRKSQESGRLALSGRTEGVLAFEGRGLQPETWKAKVELPVLELAPEAKEAPKGVQALALRSARPVRLALDQKGLRIESAQLIGADTNLEASGGINFGTRSAYNVRVKGAVNLAILHNFERSLTAAGVSTLDASLRGPLGQPEVYGRLEFKDASLYFSDVPNGIDKANGVIFFFRDRATIETLTAETGGGKLSLGGFIGFGGRELGYRLQAKAEQVRVRYPEGVSTTMDASLNLTGVTASSRLTGTVTILRTGISPRLDFAGLLAQSAQPIVTPGIQNELLRNMQFDIRVATSPDARFETTLTRDIQAEASLRLRGTPAKPILLGNLTVVQGEMNFFGNRYTINRGEVSFLNPAKLEPVVNLDLGTRVRGIDVTLTFSGPLNKLNVNYRSDPPLQLSEIIALLTVGRAPTSDPALVARQPGQEQSWEQIGASTLVGQALAAPVTGRLQRFFGVSRIKIDPQFTGVENNPQAHLTLEQQISKDITFTYITNLAKGQQQVVRVEWNVNKQWSILAVREENGLFGVDFLYRKQFK